MKKGNRAVTESLIYLHSQQPLACGARSCQNGGSCVEECDGNRKCMCTVGFTGAHCENILTTETLRKKHNKNLSFVLILSIVISHNLQAIIKFISVSGCLVQPCIGASETKQPFSSLHPYPMHLI